jgi:hypothetical protein
MNALLAAALLAAPASAVPVDLRTLESRPPSATPADFPTRSLPHNAGPYFPGCEIMASREVINELLAISEVHQNEALNLDRDALDLWNQWRNAVGQAAPGRDEARQIDAFNLHQAARLTDSRAREVMGKLEKADAAWWKLWRALDAAAKAGKDGSDMKPALEKFKARLSSLAADSNSVDAAIRSAQAQYDFTRPAVLEALESRGVAQGSLRQPWHWNYAQTGRPRPDLRYDFDSSYERKYDASHEWLRTKGLIR